MKWCKKDPLDVEVSFLFIQDYLRNMRCPPRMSESAQRNLSFYAIKYVILIKNLWSRNIDGVIQYKGPTLHVDQILKDVAQDVEALNLIPPPPTTTD